MSLFGYAKSRAWEYLLVLACSWSLTVVVMGGFWIDAALQHGLIPLVACALLLLSLYLTTWKRAAMLPGAVAVLAVAGVFIWLAVTLSAGQNPWEDAEENYVIAALCVVLCTVACFALTRTLAGSAVWFVSCVFACSFVEAAYRTGEVALSLVVLTSALSLVVWRNCTLAQSRANTMRRVSRTANLGASVLPVLGTVAVASALWFGIIAPMGPGELKLELIVDYRTENIIRMRGAGDIRPEVNTDMKTNELVDGERWTTDDLNLSDDANTEIDAKSLLEAPEQQTAPASEQSGGGASGSRSQLDPEDVEREYDAISYSWIFPLIVAVIVGVCVLAAAVAGYFAWRRAHRRKRLEAWLAADSATQVREIYLFLTGKLARLGFRLPPGTTLSQWSRNNIRSMTDLHEQTHVPFGELTATYEKVAYGGYQPTDEEVVPFVTWYLWFWKAARAHLGNVRYFFKSFRLG